MSNLIDRGQISLRRWPMSWVGVNADQAVAIIVWWGLVGKDVPPHEVAHDEKLRPCGDNRKAEEFFCCHS